MNIIIQLNTRAGMKCNTDTINTNVRPAAGYGITKRMFFPCLVGNVSWLFLGYLTKAIGYSLAISRSSGVYFNVHCRVFVINRQRNRNGFCAFV